MPEVEATLLDRSHDNHLIVHHHLGGELEVSATKLDCSHGYVLHLFKNVQGEVMQPSMPATAIADAPCPQDEEEVVGGKTQAWPQDHPNVVHYQ